MIIKDDGTIYTVQMNQEEYEAFQHMTTFMAAVASDNGTSAAELLDRMSKQLTTFRMPVHPFGGTRPVT